LAARGSYAPQPRKASDGSTSSDDSSDSSLSSPPQSAAAPPGAAPQHSSPAQIATSPDGDRSQNNGAEEIGAIDDPELQQFQEDYKEKIRLFEYLDLKGYLDAFEGPSKDALLYGYDADSMNLVTQHLPDIGFLNQSGFHFKKASSNNKPYNTRSGVRRSRKNRTGGLRPSKGDAVMKGPTSLDQFPSFTIGTIDFYGMQMHLSVYLIMEKAVGQHCHQNIIRTWNAVNKWAYGCPERVIVGLYRKGRLGLDFGNDESMVTAVKLYRLVSSGSYGFGEIGEKDKGIESKNPLITSLHLALVWFMLEAIALSETKLEETDEDSSHSLYMCSVFLLQGAGFKHIWRERLGDQNNVQCKCEYCPIQQRVQCNNWVRGKVVETHEFAKKCFFQSNISYHATTRCSIDIAVTIHCEGDWHVLPRGKLAQVTITEAVKTRANAAPQVSDEEDDGDDGDDGDGDDDDDDYDYDDDDDYDYDDDGDGDDEGNDDEDEGDEEDDDLNPIDYWEDVDGDQGDSAENESSDLSFLQRVTLLEGRTRFPKFGTTGEIGCCQIKRDTLAMNATSSDAYEAEDDDHQKVDVDHAARNLRAATIIQMYLPYYRFAFRDQVVKKKFWKGARELPRAIVRMASTFERCLIEEKAYRAERRNFCKTLKQLFHMAERFISGMKKENFHIRYEMTFETFPNQQQPIQPPVTALLTPLNCLAFVKQEQLATSMSGIFQIQKEPLERFIDLLENHSGALENIRQGEWATLTALMESLVLFCGQGRHGKGTILKASLDRELQIKSQIYQKCFWMPSPFFMRMPGNNGLLKLLFEVDPSLISVTCNVSGQCLGPIPSSLEAISNLLFDEPEVSAALLNSLPNLWHRSKIRAICRLLFLAFFEASKNTRAGDVVGEPEELDWSCIGRDVTSTEVLFELMATQFLTYHKFEVSHRLVKSLEKVLKASPRTGAKARKMKKADWNMMAKSLEAVWTSDQFREWKAGVEEIVGVDFPAKCQVKSGKTLGNSGMHR